VQDQTLMMPPHIGKLLVLRKIPLIDFIQNFRPR
jgi:hypothetical protein